jgi:CPA2 family monovalent cation:H+ antiporter-2
MIGKSIAAFVIVLLFRHPPSTAFTISASLAQIGEFSFILAGLGQSLNLLPKEGSDLILAGAILSIVFNPAVFAISDRLSGRYEKRAVEDGGDAASVDAASRSPVATTLRDHTILVGYGRVGRLVGESLRSKGQPFLVIDTSDDSLAKLRDSGVETVSGNAAKPDVLRVANPAGARYLVVAIPEAFEAGQIVQQSRAANPALQIIARAHSDAEVEHLTGLGADHVIMGEREIAHGMIEELRARAARGD